MLRIAFVPVIFATASVGLYFLASSFGDVPAPTPPVLETNDDDVIISALPDEDIFVGKRLKFPANLEELRAIASGLHSLKEERFWRILVLFCSAYVYKQTFSIPGSFFLNVGGGAVFGFKLGFPLVCVLTAIGASFSYLLSLLFASAFVHRYFPDRVAWLRARVEEERRGGSLFFFLLFLRLFPASPNWLLNVLSPLAGVPIHYFFPTVALGLLPYNFLCVQTGSVLAEVRSVDDVLAPDVLLRLAGVSVIALALALLRRRTKKVAD